MERFSNNCGMMVKNQKEGGWVKYEDINKIRNYEERFYEAQQFLKTKNTDIKNGNDKPILKTLDVAKWMAEFSNFYCG